MAQTSREKQLPQSNYDEQILVVKRSHLFPHGSWNGLKKESFATYLTIIQKHHEFLPRTLMEQDPTYKQIIPYLVFTHNERYFLMERQAKSSEQRLKSKLSLGIGGHIRKEDLYAEACRAGEHEQAKGSMEGTDIFNWARREFHEEVQYQGDFTITPLGILNDDSNDVGKVHLGFVFLLHGTSPQISVKSELRSGTLVSLEECLLVQERMETWSQMALPFLGS